MPSETYLLIGRVKAVEREYAAMRLSNDHLLKSLAEGAIDLEPSLKRMDIHRASERLEGTYVIRLFSEFEDVLRAFLRGRKFRVPHNAKPLIDRVASHAKLSGLVLDNTHHVRHHRNSLVHHSASNDGGHAEMTIRNATSYLCTFLSQSLGKR